MSDTREIISKRLAKARNDKGWTIAETAERCGWSRSRYSNWELGIRAPKYEELERVAKELDVNPCYLVGWSDQAGESGYTSVSRSSVTVGDSTVPITNAADICAYRDSYLEGRGLSGARLISVVSDDDAMADVVRRGDLLLIDTTTTRTEVRDLFAILANGRAWVRWIRPELSGNYTLGAEDRSQYPDETLTPAQLDQLAILGRVVRIERDR